MEYSKDRYRGEGITEQNLEESLSMIVDFFTEDWLNEDNDHPLQLLWKRKDVLSTNELYTFGYSLLSIKDMDAKWIDKNIKLIKGRNLNNVIGYVFEIIAASMIKNGENQELILVPPGNPVIDLITEFDDGGKLNISCKNHYISLRYKTFNKNARYIESLFLDICKKYKKNKIQCHILNLSNRQVEDRDWSNLKSGMDYMVKSFEGKELHFRIEKTWFIVLLPLDDGLKYSDMHLTYNFTLMSPFHKHERSDFYNKFDKDCHDFGKLKNEQNEDEINIIFIHLPDTALLKGCIKWAEQYLEDNQDKPIAGIFFIQNLHTTNIKSKEVYISVAMECVINDFYKSWFNKNASERKISLVPPIGQISKEIPKYIFLKGGKEVDMGDFNPDEAYIYQRGEHYVEYTDNKDIEAKTEILGKGINKYAVILSEEGEKVVRPDFPPDDRLILI